MVSNFQINKNYDVWIKLLKKYNCYSDALIEKYGDLIKKSSFSLNIDSGLCYEGSLLDVSLNKLPTNSLEIAKTILKINGVDEIDNNLKESIAKVCILQHISKCLIFTEQTNEWNRKRGYLYEFRKDLNTSLKVGERSIYMCMECGIKLSEDEFEAIRIIDKSENDDSLIYSSLLSNIIKTSNHFVNLLARMEYFKINQIKKQIEE